MSAAVSQDAFAAALADPARALPAGVTSARGAPDPLRFAVYRNNVHVSLVEALAKGFPVTRRLVGDEFFKAMARVYVGKTKPASPVMLFYGDSFPDFIAGFEPAAGLPYLPDVARLEYAWTQSYHAADAPPLGLSDVARIAPDALAAARLEPHPAARLVRSSFPVGAIWAAHQGDAVGRLAEKAGQTVLVARPGAEVRVTVIPAIDADFAAALFAGFTINDASLTGAAAAGFDAGRALVGLIGLGAFGAISREQTRR
ncbi:HvfC/BufC N-terminal domain-containing protein [Pelagibacterium xiamenense]|uniref:HvfC/BufC N-terminal domain-containing protein n=1 Tax=Pelagibacterium xiamenense TaxID=2901140 RepID=UPI001E4E4688|nr:DNA-binding domain-containing protein [Pelagibacterium xiamenense]MCD7059035.1 DNA-binding domain-containing protein [Pelagibacterium xiamenense]